MKTLLRILFFFLLVTQICFAQYSEPEKTDINNIPFPHKFKLTPHIPKESAVSMHPSFYDRKAEWASIIKQYWGPGESLQNKLITFDLFKNFIHDNNPTFLWNPINWDSLASKLRSNINDSTSSGEFARILNDLTLGLKDGHSYAYDNVVLNSPLNPGTPILVDGGGYINHFGAGLTPLEDSSLLVYKAVPNHPLGLVPGDIVLGYQGIPWYQLVRELLAGGIPTTIWVGAAPSAYNRTLLWAAGESWHLFDTIDVVKYSTGETVHLPLDTMITLNVPGTTFINNEQLPVPGVPMPVFNWNEGAVKYGIIEGTNIGYIYVYHHDYSGVSTEFDAAVLALMGTDGLIIDLRLDWGGAAGLNSGISRLMNHFTSTLDSRKRCSASDLYAICPFTPSWYIGGDIPGDYGTYYDRPIAVLLGPNCLSYGDISSWQLSYIPNVRTFGRSPQAIYSGYYGTVTRPGYTFRSPSVTFVDHYSPNEPRWGEEYPIFDDVWLTPAGVANGQDDVVNRALEWMNNLVFAHEVISDKIYYTPEEDTVHITTIIENPNSHQVSARGYLKTVEGVLIDSVDLVHQLLNPNGEQWMVNFNLPTSEDFFDISVTAFDNTQGGQFATPNATRFTTAGPVKLDSVKFLKGITNYYNLRPFVRNEGTSLTITNAKIQLKCNDPWVIAIAGAISLPSMAPGVIVGASSWIAVTYVDSLFQLHNCFNLKAEISVDGWTYWTDSLQLIIPLVGVEEENNEIPTEFSLAQNYPNPFNPNTQIKYSIPKSSQVSLKIFNTLGEEIETLVNEEKPVGIYELSWNAANLPSGVYFYRLQAGSFSETKKMILMK